jgi:hypothetical protein
MAAAGIAAVLGAGACTPPAEVVSPADLRATVPGATAIVVVYSRTGHTARMARGLSRGLGADYVRLVGDGTEGNSWLSTPSWTVDRKTAPDRIDTAPYELVLIGGPIWFWKPNALTSSFLRHADLRGKGVVLFYTFEGGGMSEATLAAFRGWAEAAGGVVRDVVGLDRKALGPGADLAAEAERIARERRDRWMGRDQRRD